MTDTIEKSVVEQILKAKKHIVENSGYGKNFYSKCTFNYYLFCVGNRDKY